MSWLRKGIKWAESYKTLLVRWQPCFQKVERFLSKGLVSPLTLGEIPRDILVGIIEHTSHIHTYMHLYRCQKLGGK